MHRAIEPTVLGIVTAVGTTWQPHVVHHRLTNNPTQVLDLNPHTRKYWSSSAGVEPAPPGPTARRSHRTKLPEGPPRSESNRRRLGFSQMLYQLSYGRIVPGVGIEPTSLAFQASAKTTSATPACGRLEQLPSPCQLSFWQVHLRAWVTGGNRTHVDCVTNSPLKPLEYGHRAGDGTRTHMLLLTREARYLSATPANSVGVTGFEPVTSASRTQRSKPN